MRPVKFMRDWWMRDASPAPKAIVNIPTRENTSQRFILPLQITVDVDSDMILEALTEPIPQGDSE